MPEATKITSTDSGYSDIHDEWVVNGRPSQFDMEGSFGGAIYHVIDTSADNPDFYRFCSMKATKIDDHGNITKGWHTINRQGYLSVGIRSDRHGMPVIIKPDIPDEL